MYSNRKTCYLFSYDDDILTDHIYQVRKSQFEICAAFKFNLLPSINFYCFTLDILFSSFVAWFGPICIN